MMERVIAISVKRPGKRNQHQKRKQKNANDLIGHKYNKQIGFHSPVDIEYPSYHPKYQIFE